MRTPSTVLLTGFEPFGDDTRNPSMEVVHCLDGWKPAPGVVVAGVALPCVFGSAIARLDAAIDTHHPSIVIALGQASSRAAITVERVAINVDDARMPDNAGACPIDAPIIEGGPAAYFSSLPIKAIVAAIRQAGLPAEVSQTAGTFVCNHVFYGLAHLIATRHPGLRGGFVHLPGLPGQASLPSGLPGMALETMHAAIRIAVQTALGTTVDARIAGGAID